MQTEHKITQQQKKQNKKLITTREYVYPIATYGIYVCVAGKYAEISGP